MLTPRFTLQVLICASPVALLCNSLVTQALLAGCTALALAMTATTLRAGETNFLLSVIRPVAIIAIVPAACILLQLLPLRPLAHPMWTSAEAALGHSLAATITIDRGASVIALGQYLSFCAVVVVAAAAAVERMRAENILFALTAAGAITALIVIAHTLFLSNTFSPMPNGQADICAAMGAIIAAAACVRTFERYETRRSTPQRSASILMRTFIACTAAFVLCTLALLLDTTREVMIATACGLAALGSVVIIRRFGLGPWGTAGIAIPVMGVALLALTTQSTGNVNNILLALAPPESNSALSERILDDTPLLGTGAGTFSAIALVYREMNDPPSGSAAPTTAAIVAIELGRPMMWLIAAGIVAVIWFLLRASLRRGRDSFYPAMGAACLVMLLLASFINRGLLGHAPGLIAGAVLGVAIAQSKTRSLQLSLPLADADPK